MTINIAKMQRSPYKHEIPMNFIHNGTKFIIADGDQRILVTAAMDGHIVSPNYGMMFNRDRTGIAQDPERNYINVHIDAFSDNYPGQKNYSYQLNGYNVNDGVYERDGWVFLVDEDAYERFLKDKDLFERTADEVLARRKAEIEADLAHAEADLARAREELANLR